MAVTPGTLGRRYAPLLAIAAVQVLLVALAPSTPQRTAVATGGATGVNGVPLDASGQPVEGISGVDVNGVPIAGGTVAGSGSGRSGAGSAVAGTAGGAAGARDLSKCDANGRQIGPTYYMPLCAPVWRGGDNGGATMTGVTGTTINYMIYGQKSDETVNAILAAQGLAASSQDSCLARVAFDKAINKRWETYGRKFVPMDGPSSGNHKGSEAHPNDSCHTPYFVGQCSLTPPDPPCIRAEADLIASLHPAYVIATASDPSFYNELGKKHILVAGGEAQPESYHVAVAPYFYDVFMDGTRAAHMMVEYWCKKMAGKPAKFAGPDVAPPSGAPRRHAGILFPATNGDPTAKLSADIVVDGFADPSCGGGDKIKQYPYQSDINTAQQQSTATVSALMQDKVTTVICFCDPIAPVFLTRAMASQNYHPENLMMGTGLIDYDVLGRLYEPSVWKYAFGLSHLQVSPPFEQTDAAKAWRDAGNAGSPNDHTSNLIWAYYSLMATSFQEAGPRPSPDTIRAGLFGAAVRGGWQESGGNPAYPKIKLGTDSGDYTGIDDAREVYWCSGRPSEIDGEPGSYFPVDNGHRYDIGEWPTGEPKVFGSAAC